MTQIHRIYAHEKFIHAYSALQIIMHLKIKKSTNRVCFITN